MSQLTSLRNLNINNCSTLTNVSSLNGLTGINYIDIRYCGLDSSSAGPIMNVLGLGDTLKYSTGQLSASQVSQLTAKGVVMPLY